MEAGLSGEITDSRAGAGSTQDESEHLVILQRKDLFKTKKMGARQKEMRQTQRAPRDQTWNSLSK